MTLFLTSKILESNRLEITQIKQSLKMTYYVNVTISIGGNLGWNYKEEINYIKSFVIPTKNIM